MKRLIFFLFLIVFIVSCHETEESPLEDGQLTILETGASECKDNLKSVGANQYIELTAESGKQLRIKFVNAVFNCCPGEIISNVFFQDQVLKVVFTEETAMCNCICEYDVECVIGSMEDRSYKIEVYINNGEVPNAKFSFTYASDLNYKYEIGND